MNKEIWEGNMLIAEFHGWKRATDNTGRGLWNYPDWDKEHWDSYQFAYHKSWNWLMKVIDIISIQFDVRITYMSEALHVTYIERRDVFDNEISSMGGMKPIENTWHAVVNFIKWYNKQPKYKSK
jgi:hypothetical protein